MLIKKQLLAFCVGIILVCFIVMLLHKERLKAEYEQELNSMSSCQRDLSKQTTRQRMRQLSGLPDNVLSRFAGNSEQVSTGGDSVAQVVILTYMRSGSSLTGDILQHSPGAFYVYEPFRALGKKPTDSYTIQYVNGTVRAPPFNMKEETSMAVRNWLTCDIGKLINIGLADNFMTKGIKTNMFKVCYKAALLKTHSKELALSRCSRQLQGICERSPVRIIKTIRLEIGTIKHLLEELPNMKLIHLVRDPRATLFSQAKMGQCGIKKGGKEGCTNKFCTRLENDVLEEEILKQKYPSRILTVFYEDIARYPIETSRNMYKFIGADFTQSAEKYVYNITMAGNTNNCAICTTRSNSSEHIDTWKTSMQKSFIDIIQRRCNYVLKRYKFEIVN